MVFKRSIKNIPNVNILLPGQRTYSLTSDVNFIPETPEKNNPSQSVIQFFIEYFVFPVQIFFAMLNVMPTIY